MYADSELMFPYFQNFSLEVQEVGDFFKSQKSDSSMSNLVQASAISDYDLGGEGDLFKAPEPIIEEPLGGLDPVTAAISMISCGEDVITSQGLDIADIESMQSDQLFSEVFYECKKDLLEKTAIESPLSEILDIKIPVVQQGEIHQNQRNESLPDDVSFQKSVSSGCLSSMEWVHGNAAKPNFVDFPVVDFGAVYGMRRAFSEGDIKTLGNISMSFKERSCSSEERREKLSRYWNKKSKRNFGRKIKYACRKALADSQPRIRGRFAKTEDSESSKRQ